MEEVLRRENLLEAYRRVMENEGAPGVDGITTHELARALQARWGAIRQELLDKRYLPSPVRKVEIPKPGGRGKRMLGVPTVIDRLIQQALLQILQPHFDATFSDASFGFRPGRSAHQALERAREHVRQGGRWVVDLDLEKFFDRVNHDVLMSRLARRIEDQRILLLIRRYLQAGIMEGGVVSPRVEGTPQGGPLSPLLSNVLLDELDKELEQRGHRFVRYADDCNIYVQSQTAGERVLTSVETFLKKRLRLTVNREKSAVDRPWRRKFLGYSVTSHYEPKLRIAEESVERLKEKLRQVFRRGRGQSLGRVLEILKPKLRGWMAYFGKTEAPEVLRTLDSWIRRKLRCLVWRHWKNPTTRYAQLLKHGVAPNWAKSAAGGRHGPWWHSGSRTLCDALPTEFLTKHGLESLVTLYRNRRRTT
jgi:group II intron reverse transcriptase/maturase